MPINYFQILHADDIIIIIIIKNYIVKNVKLNTVPYHITLWVTDMLVYELIIIKSLNFGIYSEYWGWHRWSEMIYLLLNLSWAHWSAFWWRNGEHTIHVGWDRMCRTNLLPWTSRQEGSHIEPSLVPLVHSPLGVVFTPATSKKRLHKHTKLTRMWFCVSIHIFTNIYIDI